MDGTPCFTADLHLGHRDITNYCDRTARIRALAAEFLRGSDCRSRVLNNGERPGRVTWAFIEWRRQYETDGGC